MCAPAQLSAADRTDAAWNTISVAHFLKGKTYSFSSKAKDCLSIGMPGRKWINPCFIMMSELEQVCREVNGTTLCSAITFHNGRQPQETSSRTRCLHKQKREDADCVDLVVWVWVCACCNVVVFVYNKEQRYVSWCFSHYL